MNFWKSAIIFGAVLMAVASGQNAPARPPTVAPVELNGSKGRPSTVPPPPAGPPAGSYATPPGSQNPFAPAAAGAPASYPNPFAPAAAGSAAYPNPFAPGAAAPPSNSNQFDSAPQGSCSPAPQQCQPAPQPMTIVLSCNGNQPSSGFPVPPASAPFPPPGAIDSSFYYDNQGFPLGTPVGGFPPGFHIADDGTPVVPPGVPRPPPNWDGTPSTLGFPMPNPGTPLWNMLMYWPIPSISG